MKIYEFLSCVFTFSSLVIFGSFEISVHFYFFSGAQYTKSIKNSLSQNLKPQNQTYINNGVTDLNYYALTPKSDKIVEK